MFLFFFPCLLEDCDDEEDDEEDEDDEEEEEDDLDYVKDIETDCLQYLFPISYLSSSFSFIALS
jgi:hypothetical protein